ncbi:D-alanyl-D-alanine carboxypeptidase family protein [Tardiphaga sp.]|uniref:D-alanyl-D-alanine carboxypeptidase family protein n=1 Tax=Tardiphaga sp. TaxID=1926292 RepID=UPI002615DBD7|nr:D-alanyl-D-alanine carboxypeptidase family protein [Tardiphaga sp.]MDB5616582.1 dac [Tardiphaga sp.]
MAPIVTALHTLPTAASRWRILLAGLVAVGLALSGVAYAANQSVQGAKKPVEDGGYDTDAPTAILIEASSGSVLFEKNADELRQPSSMAKLMTAELVFSMIQRGDIKLTDEYRVSENAWRKGGAPAGGATMFAALNSRVAVSDLLRGMIVQSGNDSGMILAEGIAGSEKAFADKMTARARELGLPKSTFANSNGLPDPDNRMPVREIGRLTRHMIQTYPDLYKLYNEREFTWNKIRQTNRNPLLNLLEGADGLVTGYTKEAGYGMAGTAVQNGMRLIAVVNGVDDPDDRVTEAKKLLEWGYKNFESRTLFAAGQPVGYAKVFGGDSGSVALSSKEPVKVMVQKNGSDRLIARIVYNGPVRAPVEVGRPVGIVRVMRGANVAVETPLYAAEAIGQGSTMRRAIDGASELVVGLFRAGVAKL